MKINMIINELKNKLTELELNDFYIMRYDRSGKLLLAGSFDFCYYHNIEIIFSEFSFICCPTTNFSLEYTTYYIIFEEIDYNIQIVKYYSNDGKPIKDVMISDWAKEKLAL